MPYYLNIDEISGNVTAEGHKNSIEVSSAIFSGKRSVQTNVGQATNRETSRPVIGELQITKAVDEASPKLLSRFLTGKALPFVTLSCCHSQTDSAYQVTVLSNAIVSAYQRHAIGGDKPFETLRLNFTKIEDKYMPTGSDTVTQAPVSCGYDLATATTT